MPIVHFHFFIKIDDSEYIKIAISSCHFSISVLDDLEPS